jgi:hypothetical protein
MIEDKETAPETSQSLMPFGPHRSGNTMRCTSGALRPPDGPFRTDLFVEGFAVIVYPRTAGHSLWFI